MTKWGVSVSLIQVIKTDKEVTKLEYLVAMEKLEIYCL